MDLQSFKKEYVRKEIGISEDFGKVFSFVDFANVNNWFVEDRQDWENNLLADNEKLEINVKGLKEFADALGGRVRIYYGEDHQNEKSGKFTDLLRAVFGKRNVVSKNLQRIKHYLKVDEKNNVREYEKIDKDGEKYIEIRKCNFDVEIAVDAYKMIEHYDTFCIFSGDADFVYLNNFLRRKGKRVIVIKAGYILNKLRKSANLVVNAQRIKQHIARRVKIQAKQKPD